MDATSSLIALFVLLLCFFVLSRGTRPCAPTLFDVKRLISAGEFLLAIRLYRRIYKRVSWKEARKAVEEMGKSIKAKREHYT